MIEEHFSEEVIDALLSGDSNAESLPLDLKRISQLVSVANSPATMTELAMQDTVISAYRNALATSDLGEIPERKRSMISRFLSAKVALAGLAIALTGGTAAALTGVLPVSFTKGTNPSVSLANTAAQNSSNSQVGTDTKVTDGGSTASDSNSNTTINQGILSTKSLYGLCNAYSHAFASTTTTSTSGSSGSQGLTSGAPLTATAFAELNAYAKSKNETLTELCTNIERLPASNSNRPSAMGNPSGTPQTPSVGASGQTGQVEFPPATGKGMGQSESGKVTMPSKPSRGSSTN